MNAKQVLEFAKKNGAVMVDLKFTDYPGIWQHVSHPLHQLEESSFEDGFGFDGSSIRGWQVINNSDMLMIPDPATAIMDPFTQHPTLSMVCDIVDPITREHYSRDPRWVAKKANNYLKSSGIGDTIFFGPEAEFFIFNEARFGTGANHGFYQLDSVEGAWNTGSEDDYGRPNLGNKIRHKEGYFPVGPQDTQQDIRTEMCLVMESCGITIETQHHEVATAGQAEIDMKFSPMVEMADMLMLYKYVVKNVAKRHNMTATFMPKPLFQDNGSGMHCHQSIWKDGKPLFAGNGYAGMSDMALYYIGGILARAGAGGAHEPDGEQLQAARPGIRSAGEPRVLEPQPVGRDPHSHVLAQPEGEAHRGALPRSVVQPLSRVRRDGDGRPRRHRKQDPPR